MHVVHVVPTGGWAGTEEMACAMANSSASSHRVSVVLKHNPLLDDHLLRARFAAGVEVIIAAESDTPGEMAARAIRECGKPDVVHAHLRPGLEVAWRLRDLCPVIGHVHVRYFSSQFWWVDAIGCVSPWQTRDVPEQYCGDVFLIPNCVDPFEVVGPGEVARLRSEWRASGDNSVVFGTIGRLSPEKGTDTLVKAFRAAATEQDRLIVIGDGADRERIEQLAGGDDRIVLMGYVARARRLLSAIDVYVSPSRLDSFGLSVLEAMVAGKQIVATAARGPADLLAGTPARLVPIDSTAGLAAAIEQVREDVLSSREPVQYHLDRYSTKRLEHNLSNVYRYLVDGGPQPDSLIRSATSSERATSTDRRNHA